MPLTPVAAMCHKAVARKVLIQEILQKSQGLQLWPPKVARLLGSGSKNFFQAFRFQHLAFRVFAQQGGKARQTNFGTFLQQPLHAVDVFGGGHRQVASRREGRSEEHTSELQSRPHLVCRLLLEKKKKKKKQMII